MSRTPDTSPLLRRWRILRKKPKNPSICSQHVLFFHSYTYTLHMQFFRCLFQKCPMNGRYTDCEVWDSVSSFIGSETTLLFPFDLLLCWCWYKCAMKTSSCPESECVCVCDFSVCLTHWFTSHTCGMSVTWAYWSGRERGPFSRLDFYLPNPH